MPVSGGQHSRPPLNVGISNKSPPFNRYVSGPSPALPQPDYNGKEGNTPGDSAIIDKPASPAATSDSGIELPSRKR